MTTDPQPKNAAGEILRLRDEFTQRARKEHNRARDLEEQARLAQRNANELTRQAQVLDEAYALLRYEERINVATMKLEDLSKQDAAKIAKARFVFLIDGSGSMNGRPMNATIDGLAKAAEKLSAQGANLETVLFGNVQPISMNIQDPQHREKAKGGLNSGTDMFATVEALAASLKKNQLTHVIVLTDGDLFDGSKVKPLLETMLRDFPQTTFDVVQLSDPPKRTMLYGPMERWSHASITTRPETAMAQMIQNLDITASRLRPQMSYAVLEAVAETTIDLLAKRLSENVPAVKKAPALKRPAAGK